ncbi:hypothetical protein HDU79_006501 [Rhizoclosmatium sp. JEL0117]|nr:hypothetical protein HDU79_006501 [Rhizoclosmatium sp. JEL0117]
MDLNNTQATLRRLDDSESSSGTIFRQATRPGTAGGFSTGGSASVKPVSLIGRLMGLSWWAKAAILWSLAQLIALVIAEGLVFSSSRDELNQLKAINSTNSYRGYLLLVNQTSTNVIGNAEAISIYQGLFLAAQAFQLYLALDSIITSSKIQLVATTGFNLAIFAYSCLQYTQSASLVNADAIGERNVGFLQQIPPPLGPFVFHRTATNEIVVIVLSLVFFLGWCFFATKLYNLFGWSVFKELGADVEVRKRLTVYHIYMLLLKWDVFFFVSFVVQYVLLVFGADNSTPKTVTIIFSPLGVLALLLLAYFAVTRESNFLMTLLLVGLSAGIGYLVDRLIDIWTVNDPGKYKSCKWSLTLFTALTLLVSLATFGVAVLNFLNFGKGLMQSLNAKRTPANTIDRSVEMNALATGETRSYGTSSVGATTQNGSGPNTLRR